MTISFKMDGLLNQFSSLSGEFSAMAACILFPHVPASPSVPLPVLYWTLQHLELVIEAVDGAESELPGLLVLVVEAVEAERGGDTVALGGK